MTSLRPIHLAALAALLLPPTLRADETLDWSRLRLKTVHKAHLAREGSAYRLRLDSAEWDSGLIIAPADAETFDFSRAQTLALDLENRSPTRQLRLTLHLASGAPSADAADHAAAPLQRPRRVNTGLALNPGERATLRFPLPHPDRRRAPDGLPGPVALDTARLAPIELKMQWPFEPEQPALVDAALLAIRLEGRHNPAPSVPTNTPYCPFVDPFGQYRHATWPEKVSNPNQLRQDLQRERAALLPPPQAWDSFGGWLDGPKYPESPHFRTIQRDGKWWLLTPSGRLFFSLGIDVVRPCTDPTPVAKHPEWYDLPEPATGPVPYALLNLRHKFQTPAPEAAYATFALQRLDSWGVNTLGAWCAPELVGRAKPYVLTLFERHPDLPTIPRLKHYDVFAPDFDARLLRAAEQTFRQRPYLARAAQDPYCIGFFIDNELDFAHLVPRTLAAPPGTPARDALIRRLKSRHPILQAANQLWGTSLTNWNQLVAPPKNKEFAAEMRAFESEWCERYFRACRHALDRLAPGKLYLGCRFIGLRQQSHLWRAAARYCDVITANVYAHSVHNAPHDPIPPGAPKRPLLIGEFHFGCLDRGLFRAGLCPVADQRERARAFERFVQGALCHPLIVGCHYFQYRDQPLTGRGDGEAYQIGFVDGCDRPYPELVRAARQAGENLYPYRLRGIPTNAWSIPEK